MAAHLLNTFLLLAALTMSVYWAEGGVAFGSDTRRDGLMRLTLGALAILLVSVTGAITALGDTLFPSASLAAGLSADLSATSHILIRLRTIHPILAVMVAVYLMTDVWRIAGGRASARSTARAMTWLIAAQLAAGIVNVLLLAPVWLQLAHLLLADAVWVGYVFLAADAVAAPSRAAAITSPYARPA